MGDKSKSAFDADSILTRPYDDYRSLYYVMERDDAEEEREAAIANGWKYVVGVYLDRP